MSELTRWPESIMRLSEEVEALIHDLLELSTSWDPLDVRRALLFRDLAATVASLDRELNELAAMDHDGIRGDSFSHENLREADDEDVDGPWELTCCNCGVPYCTRFLAFYETPRERNRFKHWARHEGCFCLVTHVYTDFDSYGRTRIWKCYPCCSDECRLKLQRKFKFHKQRRTNEWEAIKESKKLLREARIWLRERIKPQEVSASLLRESKREPTSQT